MPILTQGIEHGEFLLSEANGMQSRDSETVTVAGAIALPSGTALGRVTANQKLVRYDNAAVDGSQQVVAVLLEACPAINGDYKRTVIARQAEVVGNRLNGGVALDAPGVADLKALGILVR